MVASVMRWRPWPPMVSKKFRVRLVVHRMEATETETTTAAAAEVRWKGPRVTLSSLRRSVKRNRTREEEAKGNGVVEWNEEFESICGLTGYGENEFHPWEIEISIFDGLNQGQKNKGTILGTTSLNIAAFVSTAEEVIVINLPLSPPGVSTKSHASIHLTLSLLELKTCQDSSELQQRSIVPPSLSPPSDIPHSEKDEISALKFGLRKVQILKEFVSARKAKKPCRDDEGSEGRCSVPSEDTENIYQFDTDSFKDDLDEARLEEDKEDPSIRKSFSYGTLASANYLGGSFYYDMRINVEDEDWVYYSHRRSDVGCPRVEEPMPSVSDQSFVQSTKRSILPWKKRKFTIIRSPKAKGEPLLKKTNGEEGGDDIDYDRRQLSSSDESIPGVRHKNDDDGATNRSSVSDFGDDNFEVGSWECKELVSRDGQMKLSAHVFFASIDQRSERASGESACTALVAVIADFLQMNGGTMPIKSQLDTLIREGSLDWRVLCEDEKYRERFPDKHFDLDTVLGASTRPVSVNPGKSFIGFFHPDGIEGNAGFDFLHGAMSFDSIWEEISRAGPQIYIVSWNDHFFVLKVESGGYYIIDTLGERLYEGCSQAYILRFDESTSIHRAPSGEGAEEQIVCRGKESCKEYIKSFLAAIPIRELEDDIKKGRVASVPLHHRLQIEFHYTESSGGKVTGCFCPNSGG